MLSDLRVYDFRVRSYMHERMTQIGLCLWLIACASIQNECNKHIENRIASTKNINKCIITSSILMLLSSAARVRAANRRLGR